VSAVIRVDDHPAADRFEALLDLVAGTWVPMEYSSSHQSDYWGLFRVNGLGALQVVVMDVLPITVSRTPRLIRRADPDLLKLVMPVPRSGDCLVSQGDRQARLRPGEFAFYDTRRPFEVRCGVDGVDGADGGGERTRARALTFMFSRSLLPLPPSHIERLTAVRMPASGGVGALASQFLLQLATTIDDCSPVEAVRLSTSALEILATRLARELDVADRVPPETHRRALVAGIHAFIDQHLGDTDLGPQAIASANHVSLRYLHKLFREEGATVSGWVRHRRLERCRRDLSDPALAGLPAAAIAVRWGFSSATYFGQVFRSAHGVTPAEFRRSALALAPVPDRGIVRPIDSTVR
jgi:AraC-like DNA-binding protein